METATPPEDQAAEARVVAGVRARLADLVEADPSPAELALVLRLLRSFAAKTPPAVDELIHLLRAGTPGPVREQAHSLKGSAANIGAAGLSAVCSQIEDRARAGVVDDPGPMENRLRTEIGGALRAVLRLTGEYEAAERRRGPR